MPMLSDYPPGWPGPQPADPSQPLGDMQLSWRESFNISLVSSLLNAAIDAMQSGKRNAEGFERDERDANEDSVEGVEGWMGTVHR